MVKNITIKLKDLRKNLYYEKNKDFEVKQITNTTEFKINSTLNTVKVNKLIKTGYKIIIS